MDLGVTPSPWVRLSERLEPSWESCLVFVAVVMLWFILLLQEESKRWTVRLDISAPQVIFPDDFKFKNPVLVVVDLGRMLLTNTQGTV